MTTFEPLNIVRPLPLRVEDFLLLHDSGAFVGFGKTELIEGQIVFMNAQHRPHARIKIELFKALDRAIEGSGTGLSVLIEATVAMPPHNAPEPDLILTSEPDGEGPVPIKSVALLVEISDTTLAQDLGVKARVYAANGVPEYWVVDIRQRVIHQLRQPDDTGFGRHAQVPFGTPLCLATMDDMIVATDRLN